MTTQRAAPRRRRTGARVREQMATALCERCGQTRDEDALQLVGEERWCLRCYLEWFYPDE